MATSGARVALVAHGIHDGGGMERATAELIRRGADRYSFIVYATELAPDLRPLVEWRRIPVPLRPFPLKLPLFFFIAGARLALGRHDLVHTVGAIVPNRADLCSVHFSHLGFRAATGRLTPPGLSVLKRLNTAIARVFNVAVERWCYGRARLLATVSAGTAKELRRHHPRAQVVVTPNGVDASRFRPDAHSRQQIRVENGVDHEDTVMLFVGGDWERKGVPIALRGLASAVMLTSHPLRLWIVGEGDDAGLHQLARDLGVEHCVRTLGHQTATERYYSAADVAVLLSVYEAFPLASLEAAAANLPLIATRVSGVEDLVGDDEAGLLVDRDPQAVGAALVRLAEDPELRATLGAEGRRRAEAHSWKRSAEDVLALYRSLVPDSSAVPEPA